MAKIAKDNEEQSKNPNLREHRIFVRMTTEEFLELKTRALNNNRKVSEYVRETVFADKWVKLNDDWHLYDELRSTHNDLNRLGNYLIHLTSVLEQKALSTDVIKSVKKLQAHVHDAIQTTDKAKELAHQAVFGKKI